jgi:hypothetical protein
LSGLQLTTIENRKMNLTVVITGLIVLAIFIVPFYWVAHSHKHTNQSEPGVSAQTPKQADALPKTNKVKKH